MNTTPVLCLGTPLGYWPSIAYALQSPRDAADQTPLDMWIAARLGVTMPMPETGSEYEACLRILSNQNPRSPTVDLSCPFPEFHSASRVFCSGLSCWLVDDLLERMPDARLLAFYESPASMLARCLDVLPAATPESLIDVWKTATAKVLACLRRSRSRVFLVSAEECLAAPQSFRHWLQATLDRSWECELCPLPPPVDTALLSLSETFCSATPSLLPLVQECEASLRPLKGSDTPLPSAHSAAISRAGLLHSLSLKREMARAQTELAASRENSAQKFREALVVHETLLLEIQNAHKESEGFFEQFTQAQEATRLAESQLESLRAELASAQSQAAALAGELDSEKHRSSCLESDLTSIRETTTQKLQAASGLQERLLHEIHSSHTESEQYFERWKKSELISGHLSLSSDRLVRTQLNDRSDHRHLQFSLHSVELFGRNWPRLDFRLVIHHGNVGLVLFQPAQGPNPPLYAWEPSGAENDVPYVLIIPTHSESRRSLVAATSHDLLLLRDAVALLVADLQFYGNPHQCDSNWAHLASRLLEELNSLPERLHYDSVQTRVNHSVRGNSTLFFQVKNAHFRGRTHSSLPLSWTPSDKGGGSLSLTAGHKCLHPLNHWPLTPSGSLAPEWTFNFDTSESLKQKRKEWTRFSENEKSLLRALISELPNFVFHLLREHPSAELNSLALRRQARKMLAAFNQLGGRPSPVTRLRLILSA